MEAVTRYLAQVRVPNANSKVWKDECAYTFETPVIKSGVLCLDLAKVVDIVCMKQESEEGLFVDLNSFIGFSKDSVILNFGKTGHGLYLHINRSPKVSFPP